MVILDTCALIELCEDKNSISKKTSDLIDQNGATILSVCFAEMALKIKKKQLFLNTTAQELFYHYRTVSLSQIISIGCEEWFDSIELDWPHKDPVDRLLVAYARRLDIPIVTTDKQIKKFYKKVIW